MKTEQTKKPATSKQQQTNKPQKSQRCSSGNFGLDVHRNHSGLLGTGRLGGFRNYISNTYSLHCHHQNDSALKWAILMFSLIVWAKSQDSVHKPQFLKRRERRAEADRTEVLLLTAKRLTTRPHRLTCV